MPYKRKARIVFLAYGDVYRARLATAIALRLGQNFLEARACTLAPVQPLNLSALAADQNQYADEMTALDGAAINWMDLLICLDAQAEALCPELPPRVQKRVYPYAAPTDAASLAALSLALEQRIAGIVGGIKMIA